MKFDGEEIESDPGWITSEEEFVVAKGEEIKLIKTFSALIQTVCGLTLGNFGLLFLEIVVMSCCYREMGE